MEMTLRADKSHKPQSTSFFHLSSHSSSILEENDAFNFQNDDISCKKFRITQPNISLVCTNIREKNNPQRNISCGSPENKLLPSKQTSNEADSCVSEDKINVRDIVLPLEDSKESNLKKLPVLKSLSQTPGALYTLREKRKQFTNHLPKCILSPEVRYILGKSKKSHLKQPYSEMKAYSPVSYNSKKSSSFHLFEREGSFIAESIPSTVEPFLKSVNENSEKKSFANSTLSTNTLMKGNFISDSKENIQQITIQASNLSLKAINENSGMTSITNLTPAPTSAFTSFVRPEVNLSHQNNKVNLNEKCAEKFSQNEYRQKSKDFSVNKNDSLQLLSNSILDAADSLECRTMSEIYPAKILLKNESGIIQSSIKEDLHSLPEISDLNIDLKENQISMVSSHVLPFPVNQKKVLLDPILRCESEILNLKMGYNNQNISKRIVEAETDLESSEVKNTLMSNASDIKKFSLNSNLHESQRDKNQNISEKLVLESPKNTNLPEVIIPHFENKYDLNKTIIRDKILDLSHSVTNFVAPEQNTNSTFISKREISKVFNPDVNKTKDSVDQDKNPNLSTLHVSLSDKSSNLIAENSLKQSNKLQERDISYSKPTEALNLEEASLKTVASKNIETILEMKMINCSEKSQKKIVDYPIEKDCNEKCDAHGMNTSSDKTSNFSANLCKLSGDLNENSPSKIDKKNSDPTFSQNAMEINMTTKATNIKESVKDTTVQVIESSSKGFHDMSTNDCCSRSSDELHELDSLRNKYEEASKGSYWKLRSLNKEGAIFKLEWGVWCYKCAFVIQVKNTNKGKSCITLTPYTYDPDDEYKTLGYKTFQFLANGDVSVFSDDIIEKLAEYSSIAERVETLMRDILHISIDYIYILSNDMDPLKLCVEVLNDNHLSKLLITFHINLQSYPSEKIVPEVKHMMNNDITKEVKEAIVNIEPGKDYLWNMLKLASKL